MTYTVSRNQKKNINQYLKAIFSKDTEISQKDKLIENLNKVLSDDKKLHFTDKDYDEINKLSEDEIQNKISNIKNLIVDDIESNDSISKKDFTEAFKSIQDFIDGNKTPENNTSEKEASNEKSDEQKTYKPAEKNKNEGEWDNWHKRQMESIKKKNPRAYEAISDLKNEDDQRAAIKQLLDRGILKPEDLTKTKEPVRQQAVRQPPATQKPQSYHDPSNYKDPVKAGALRQYWRDRGVRKEQKKLDKEYIEQSRENDLRYRIEKGRIEQIERQAREYIGKTSLGRSKHRENITEFNTECERKIKGFDNMSAEQKKTAIEQRVKTDQEFKLAHNRVVHGYKQLTAYDEQMTNVLTRAEEHKIDITRDAEEYDNIKKNIPLKPPLGESEEMTKSRSVFEQVTERLRDAIKNLMMAFGFGKKGAEAAGPEQASPSSTMKGPGM